MKIGVVGTFIRDRIYPWLGEPLDSIGGIFFTVSYLANLAQSKADIYPVCNLGSDFYDHVTRALSRYPNVKLAGLNKHSQTNTQVTLTYTGPQEREEVTTSVMPPVNSRQMELLCDMDAVIFNLITGDDVALDAMKQFRKQSKALVYLDFHTHCLAIDENRKRYYRRPDDWREWIENVDILQMNEKEAQTLAGSEYPLDDCELTDFGRQLLHIGPSICNFTLADRGSMLVFSRGSRFESIHIPSIHIDNVVDIIGCGDAFEAAFVLCLLQGTGEVESAAYANLVAAINTTFLGSSEIGRIHEKIRNFEREEQDTAKDLQ